MPEEKRKVTIEVLMEGSGGDLVFQPIKASKDDLRDLIEASKNPVIKHNIESRAKEKKMRMQLK